jgi:hypothetical protein
MPCRLTKVEHANKVNNARRLHLRTLVHLHGARGCSVAPPSVGGRDGGRRGREGLTSSVRWLQMSQLREFAASRNLPKPLRDRLRTFYAFLYTQRTVFDETEILNELPMHMRQEVIAVMYHLSVISMAIGTLG